MKFEWDEDKNQINILKHKVSFNVAILVFRDEYRLEYYDYEHSTEDEDRYVTIGEVTRIISARKATANERRMYYGN